MEKATKKELSAAAKELNALIKPDPPIPTDGSVKDMLAKVTLAAGLLEPGDTVSSETGKLLKNQGIDHKGTVTPPAAKRTAAPKKTQDAEKKADKSKGPDKGKTAAAAPAKPKTGMNRLESVVQVLQQSKKPLSKDEIIKKADGLYVKDGGKSNEKESKWAAGMILQVATLLNAVVATEKGTYALS